MRDASNRLTPGPQTPEALAALATELDDLRAHTLAQLGEADASYIRHILWAARAGELAGRLMLLAAAACWPALLSETAPWAWALLAVGATVFGLAKILENMEFGHNVLHSQYDWMNDPHVDGKALEWDIACPAADWRYSHNYLHHRYTNVLGVDRDFGYGKVRLSGDMPWSWRHLIQVPFSLLIIAPLFQWWVALHHMQTERLREDPKAAWARIRALWPNVRAKMWRQIRKDYVAWPMVGALTGALLGQGWMPGVLTVVLGGLLANLMRNLWTATLIFCGHFTRDIYVFDASRIAQETRGHWYLRQILGTSNIHGGRWFHIITGNLTHHVEHHLFPDLPASRYPALAPQVRDICRRHGIPYNTGSLGRQVGTVLMRLARFSIPGGPCIASQHIQADTALPTQH